MLGGLLLLVLIAAGIWAFSQYENRHRGDASLGAAGPGRPRSLERWVEAELISAEQADAISAFEAARAEVPSGLHLPIARSSRVPAVAEAVGYLGAVLAVTGLIVVLSRSWSDLAVGGQLAIAGLAAIAGIGGGSVVEEAADPALARLRWSLWAMGTAAMGVAAWVVADPWAGLRSDQQVALMITATLAVVSGALWAGRPRPLQQLVALGGALAALGFAATSIANPGVAGAVLWLAAAGLLAGSLLAALPGPAIGTMSASVGLVAGGFVMAASWQAPGLVLASASALGVLVLVGWRASPGTRGAKAAATLVGLVGLLASLPQTVGYLSGDGGLATGLVLLGLGVGLLLAADRGLLTVAPAFAVLGAGFALGGPGVVASQLEGLGLLMGLAVAAALVGLGATPGRSLLSAVGLFGLLGYVPSTLIHFFPGRSKAPIAILVTGLLLVAGAVALARRGGQIRADVSRMGRPKPAS